MRQDGQSRHRGREYRAPGENGGLAPPVCHDAQRDEQKHGPQVKCAQEYADLRQGQVQGVTPKRRKNREAKSDRREAGLLQRRQREHAPTAGSGRDVTEAWRTRIPEKRH